MIRILLAPTLELAQSAPLADITIEAEYGLALIEGVLYTAAHHGPRAGRPAPCVDTDIPRIGVGDILVSHIDLDTIGGCGRAMGHPALAGRHAMFWALAAHVDVAGPHRLAEARRWPVAPSARVERELYAYWAWSQANRPRLDLGRVHDVTDEVKRHLALLLDIFGEGEDGSLLRAGDAFKAAETALNENSWVQTLEYEEGCHRVAVRVSAAFVNHLYVQPDGAVVDGVVALNPKTGVITLSWADAGTNTSADACQVMQAVFGPGAGGHKGIAGSPRGIRMTVQDLVKVLEYLQD